MFRKTIGPQNGCASVYVELWCPHLIYALLSENGAAVPTHAILEKFRDFQLDTQKSQSALKKVLRSLGGGPKLTSSIVSYIMVS